MSEARNLLAGEASPYLLQHAGNPVHWRPWGDAAFAEARGLNRPVLLSIGYAACHWCHVMAHESFENEETAALMNALYVNVKVDREERPDVDHIYMAALHALGEHGGWPMTMFLTPDGAPFFGGTYWPPQARWGKPGFRDVLRSVEAAWRDRRGELVGYGERLVAHLRERAAPASGAFALQSVSETAAGLLFAVDPVNGGLGNAPKFPNAPLFRLLWNEYCRTCDARFRAPVTALLDAVSMGGIYDHLGGGYARYSTDARWHVPHFEKMLYDNAQILELLAFAHAEAPSALYAARAEETVAWLFREMSVGDAFAASLDADSEGEEGRFYVWTAGEIDAALGADASAFKAAYDVRAEGNWEGVNVLRRVTPLGDAEAEAALGVSRATLLARRERRPRPSRDDKVLADWNALTIGALAKAAAVFRRPEWLARAEAAFEFLERTLRGPDGRLRHSWREGVLGPEAMLDDVAGMARAALALYESTGARRNFEAASTYATWALDRFGDGAGGVFVTAADARDAPPVRPRHAEDGAAPSGAGVLAETLAGLWHVTGEDHWRSAAERLIAAFASDGFRQSPLLLVAADSLDRGGAIWVEGPYGDPRAVALASSALASPDPAQQTVRVDPESWRPPFARPPLPETPAAMFCRGQTCSLPVRDPEALAALIRAR